MLGLRNILRTIISRIICGIDTGRYVNLGLVSLTWPSAPQLACLGTQCRTHQRSSFDSVRYFIVLALK
jgi:hypothetical protein